MELVYDKKLLQSRKKYLFWGYSKWQQVKHSTQIFGGWNVQTMLHLQKNVWCVRKSMFKIVYKNMKSTEYVMCTKKHISKLFTKTWNLRSMWCVRKSIFQNCLQKQNLRSMWCVRKKFQNCLQKREIYGVCDVYEKAYFKIVYKNVKSTEECMVCTKEHVRNRLSLRAWVEKMLHWLKIHLFFVEEKFRVQWSVKKSMLTIFWDMKRPITIDNHIGECKRHWLYFNAIVT